MKRKYMALFAAVFAGMLAGCGGNDKNVDAGQPAAAQSASAQSAQTHGKGGGLSGESAPTFSLRDLAGQQIAVEAKGKPYVINFWATWCPPCKAEIPDIAAFYAAHHDKVDFYAVNLQEDEQPVQKFLTEHKVDLPVLLDQKGSAANLYGVRAIPTTIVVGADGIIVYRKTGGVTKEELEDVINRL